MVFNTYSISLVLSKGERLHNNSRIAELVEPTAFLTEYRHTGKQQQNKSVQNQIDYRQDN